MHIFETDDAEAALLAWREVDRVHGTFDDEGMDALLRLRTTADRIEGDRLRALSSSQAGLASMGGADDVATAARRMAEVRW